MNTVPIILTLENFPRVIHGYFPVDQTEDISTLLHAYDETLEEYLTQRKHLYESKQKYTERMLSSVPPFGPGIQGSVPSGLNGSRLKSNSNEVEATALRAMGVEESLSFFGEDLNLVPYTNLKDDGTFNINDNNACTQEDVEIIAKSIEDKLNIQNTTSVKQTNTIFESLKGSLPQNYFSYESNSAYLEKVYNYVDKCRFTNVESYFKMAQPIFSIQQEIYDMFKSKEYMLISGGTGVGKTAVIPLLYYHFLKSQNSNKDDYSIHICEPRISTTKNPFHFLRLNTGSDLKFTFNDIDKVFEKRYKINKKLKIHTNDYIERVYNGFQYIQMIYRGHNYIVKNKFKNTKLTFMTDGIFYSRLVRNPKSVFSQSLIVIDEVHENSLNSLIGLAILSAYRDEYMNEDTKYNMRVMLITALCQPSEKIIFNNLLPGLYEFDKLPTVTKYKVIEVPRPRGDTVEKCVNVNENGLVFVPNEMAIDSYIKDLSAKFESLLCIKLTRNTNIHVYNGDVTRYLTTYAINRNRKYLVIATNVAESSITFPDLDYVIDLGKQLNVNYDIYTRSYKIQNEYMTLNSKVQRMGRVGRTQDGKYIRLYEQSDLVEYKNRIHSENLTSYLIDIICNVKSDTLRTRIIEKIRDSFSCEQVIKQYIKEFEYANLIKESKTYSPSDNLVTIYSLKHSLRRKFQRKQHTDPTISTDGDESDEEEDDQETQAVENNDAELKILTMLYYCNIEQVRKLLVLLYEGKLIKLLESDDYSRFVNYHTDVATKSDIIVLLKYLQSYPVNGLGTLNKIIENKIPTYGNSPFEDIDIRIFESIRKALHFDMTFTNSRSKYSRVSNFRSAYFIEIDKFCTLLHSTGYVRDFGFNKM